MTYQEVTTRIRAAAEAAARHVDDITIVAVSKTKSVDDIKAVYDQGHRDFGENRAQELAEKVPALPDDIRWHFVGALQSRKARTVRPLAYLLHSMDRRSLANAWMKGHGHPPPVLAQVNVGEEEQKSGLGVAEVPEAIDWMIALGLDVRGLMAIPPIPDTPEDSRPYFAMLRDLRDSIAPKHPSVRELSMGMTDDFEVAIAEGASIIRVGRAIFGTRNPTGA
ncbi:MAG TPA: YggS family pyridoxal phosphate-dependent enzyme [Acidimicrobiia bacterium]|jgi:pyridoxal phosphate enzyme (YggS family)|nr:YggS family pyridoxal phosphate-dependent enzyme [Acidimicrobiia bacterium]